jgi:predicted phosphodiesterase
MFLRIVSDLHIEFIPTSKWEDELEVLVPYLPNEKDMVLVLAGDTISADLREDITPWIKDLSQRHRAVVMVTGNHEGYHGSRSIATTYWQYAAAMNKDLYVLENDTLFIDNVRFLGTTLWTALAGPLDHLFVYEMNDFDFIQGWTVAQWKYAHGLAVEFLHDMLDQEFDGKTVVVTHHLPTFSSIGEKYLNDKDNCGYATNLDNLIGYNDIAVWFHGHTHDSFDYMAGDTRIVCNPHGYFPTRENGDRRNPNFNPTMVVDV